MANNSLDATDYSADSSVTIVIPTLASIDRKHQLLRATHSIFDASRKEVSVIVCVNGSRWNQESIAAIEKIPGVSIYMLPEPSLPKALAFGRSMVKTPYFGFLDDDDQYLPGAIDKRLKVLQEGNCDLVTSNGILRTPEGDQIMLNGLSAVPENPLLALFNGNWLPSCGGLFRTESVGQNYFDDYHEYAEWTWLAYRVALDEKQVAVLDEPTFIVNDTADSLSKSHAYRKAYLALFERMQALNPPSPIPDILRARIASQLHDFSCESLECGQLVEATRQHLRSIFISGGWRYLPYSRHLARAIFMSLLVTKGKKN